MKDKLVVCLNAARMIESAQGSAQYDIRAMVKSVPSLTILSGDPSLAVRVEVDQQYTNYLRSAVQDFCTVGPTVEFKLFGKPQAASLRRLAL
jgi:formate-dependent phosphoribosylglycinamide formyltransferase (GAR transformylase)